MSINLRKLILGLLVVSLSCVTFPFRGFAATDVEFVLDISGSMKQKLNGETQIDSARRALNNALKEISPESLVALRVYGHRVEQTNKAESCKDTELVVPFQKLNTALIEQKANALTPRGYTPIALSLRETRNDLLDVAVGRETERTIILLTDGEETCGGDPVGEVEKLKAEGFHLTIYTIGFNVNDLGRKQLQAIASAGGGKYYEARNAQELTESLRDAAKESTVVQKEKKTYGEAIRGGSSYEDAVQLPFNKELKLDHHQRKNDFDYFYFEATPADGITVSLATLEKGINERSPGKMVETDYPYAGMQIHGSNREKIKGEEIVGDRNGRRELVLRVPAPGKYYLLIGSTYEAQNKDHVTFQAKKESRGDLGGSVDAGSDIDSALALTGEKFIKNFIGGPDRIDYFSFTAKKGEKYIVGVIPSGKPTAYFSAKVIDEFKQEMMRQGSKTSGSGFKSEPFLITEDGTFYLEISYEYDDLVEYSFILRKVSSEAVEGGTPATQTEAPSAEGLR